MDLVPSCGMRSHAALAAEGMGRRLMRRREVCRGEFVEKVQGGIAIGGKYIGRDQENASPGLH